MSAISHEQTIVFTERDYQQEKRYSVIVPAYNAEKTLGACLEALLQQSVNCDKYEIIVVDDGSTDRTIEVANGYSARVLGQNHLGPACARNLGAKVAIGDFLLFTDADCIPTFNWIEEIVRPLENDPLVAGVKGSYRTFQANLIARVAQVEFEEKYARLRRQKCIDFVDTGSAAFRKETFWEMGGFDPGFPSASNEDTELSFNLVSRGWNLIFAETAIVYHKHPESLAPYLLRKWRHGYWRVRVYRSYPSKLAGDSYTPRSTQLQMATSVITLLGVLLPGLRGYAIVSGLIFFLATLPFVRRGFAVSRAVAFVIPFIFFLRSIALGIGLVTGALMLPFGRRRLRRYSVSPNRDTTKAQER